MGTITIILLREISEKKKEGIGYTYIWKGKLGRGTKNTPAREHEESCDGCTWPSLHQQAPKYVC